MRHWQGDMTLARCVDRNGSIMNRKIFLLLWPLLVLGCQKSKTDSELESLKTRLSVLEVNTQTQNALLENQTGLMKTYAILDFSNKEGYQKLLVNEGFVLVSSEGATAKGDGYVIHLGITNPMAV